MAEFVPSPGFKNCPKCNGWQVIDFTKRKANGWPNGSFDYRDCDNCEGRGEIPLNPNPWPNVKPAKKPAGPVTLDNDVPMPELDIPPCTHYNLSPFWGKSKCNDCGAIL